MCKKYFFLVLIYAFIFTACSQLSSILPSVNGPLVTPEEKNISGLNSPTVGVESAAAAIDEQIPSPTQTIIHTPKPTRTPRPTYTPSPTLPPIIRYDLDNIPDYVNPLTGLVAINPSSLERRPVAVKISNAPHSIRPQFGLSLADHVYEYYLEWGLTRFIAIFYSNDAVKVGPIRSGRIFDRNIMDMYNAILVFNGADKRVMDYFEEAGVDDDLFVVERECPPLCRDENFPPVHNLFGNITLIHEYINSHGTENRRFELATNSFYSLGGLGKDLAYRIYINYSYANYAYWEYDPVTNQYLRFQGSVDLVNGREEVYKLLTDRLTDKPVIADNVVILFVPHEFYLKSSDTEMFSINLEDSGDAYIFRNGKAFIATWERKDTHKPLYLLSPDGSNFPLKPGVTFFQIINTTSQMTRDNRIWTFTFERPIEEEE